MFPTTRRTHGHTLAIAIASAALSVGVLTGSALPADAQPKTYPVAVNEHGLRVREKPSTSARVVGGLFPGDRVRIICTTVGTTVHGRLGTSNIWDKTGESKWVSDQYVRTGSDRPVAPSCSKNTPKSPPPPPPPPPPVFDVTQSCGGRMHAVRAHGYGNNLIVSINPAGWARWVHSGNMWDGVWACLGQASLDAGKLGLNGDQTESMREQLLCHEAWAVAWPGGDLGGSTWDLESWRPVIGEVQAVARVDKRCNW